jgi:hypothetical protein
MRVEYQAQMNFSLGLLIRQKDILVRALKLIHKVMKDMEVQDQLHLNYVFIQDQDHQEGEDLLSLPVHHHIAYKEVFTMYRIIII